MKLENQVVSLELAKKLKELGVKQDSAFIWLNTNHGTECVLEPDVDRWYDGQWRNGWSVDCSAFTVAELGEMLPQRYQQAVFHERNIPSNNEYRHDFVIGYGRSTRSKQPVVGEVYQGGIEVYHYCYSFPSSRSPRHLESASVKFEADTEADARAKMLIYLMENNLITPTH